MRRPSWWREPIVVLLGQDENPGNAPFSGRFRQKNDFAYLTGVETPAACLILLPNQERETLYLPPASAAGHTMEEAQDGPGPDTARKLAFASVESTARFLGDLFSAIGDPRKSVPGRTRIPVVYTVSREGRQAQSSTSPDAQFVRFLAKGHPPPRSRTSRRSWPRCAR